MASDGQTPFSVAIVLNRDLMFGSRISHALKQIGLEARFVPDTGPFVDMVEGAAEELSIAIVDMNGSVDWDRLSVLTAGSGAVPILAFGPHVDAEGRRAAKSAGVTRIVSNGQFSGDMVALIERYRRRPG